MRAACLLLLVALVGCDASSGDGPAWTQPGAVAVFDYTPGPDSIYALQFPPGQPYAAVPATDRLVQMEIAPAPDWRPTDRYVRWRETVDPTFTLTRFAGEVLFPLDDDAVELAADGLAVVVATQCTGNGWFGGSSSDLAFIRVPNRAGTLEVFTNCSRGPGYHPLPATGPEAVTVPAGTFQAIRIDSGRSVEWWSWEAGLVRLDVLGDGGVLRGRFERSAGA